MIIVADKKLPYPLFSPVANQQIQSGYILYRLRKGGKRARTADHCPRRGAEDGMGRKKNNFHSLFRAATGRLKTQLTVGRAVNDCLSFLVFVSEACKPKLLLDGNTPYQFKYSYLVLMSA